MVLVDFRNALSEPGEIQRNRRNPPALHQTVYQEEEFLRFAQGKGRNEDTPARGEEAGRFRRELLDLLFPFPGVGHRVIGIGAFHDEHVDPPLRDHGPRNQPLIGKRNVAGIVERALPLLDEDPGGAENVPGGYEVDANVPSQPDPLAPGGQFPAGNGGMIFQPGDLPF